MVKILKKVLNKFSNNAIIFNSKSTTILSIIILIVFLIFIENKLILFGSNIVSSNAVWMFVLININATMLMFLILLVFRHILKIFYDRNRKIIGAKLRSRFIIAFVFLSLFPAVVFIFPVKFIDTSIKSWFNKATTEMLGDSINFCDCFYNYVFQKQELTINRIIKYIKTKRLYKPKRRDNLSRCIMSMQLDYGLDAVSVYSGSINPNLLASTISQGCNSRQFRYPPESQFVMDTALEDNVVRFNLFRDNDLLHTIGTICLDSGLALHIVCSTFIDKDLYEKISAVNKSYDYYSAILSLRKPIQITYYINLFIVTLFVVFFAIWVGFYFARIIITPITNLVYGTRRIAEGDLSFTIKKTTYDGEIGNIVDSFNKMVGDFLISQKQFKLSTKKLEKQNKEIEEHRQYMEIVLKSVSAGVITLDANGLVVTFNISAEKMFNLNANNVLHSSYNKLFSSEYFKAIRDILDDLYKNKKQTFEVPLRTTNKGLLRSFLVYINGLQDEIGRHIGVVMVFDDLTELEKAQRVVAWREVARRITHEVKNPLTPITLIAQRLCRKYSEQINESIFIECIRMIIDHVDLIRNLVDEFSTFARFPMINPKPCNLSPIIEETIASYKEGHSKITFSCLISEGIPNLNIDRQQFKRAMINLLDNAVTALKNEGYITITVSYDSNLSLVSIEISDSGPGIKDEDKIKLFEPNFSTKKSGMGLGLTIVNAIIADHNGIIHVHDNEPSGTSFIIELPV